MIGTIGYCVILGYEASLSMFSDASLTEVVLYNVSEDNNYFVHLTTFESDVDGEDHIQLQYIWLYTPCAITCHQQTNPPA
jgi:hypothetical protein